MRPYPGATPRWASAIDLSWDAIHRLRDATSALLDPMHDLPHAAVEPIPTNRSGRDAPQALSDPVSTLLDTMHAQPDATQRQARASNVWFDTAEARPDTANRQADTAKVRLDTPNDQTDTAGARRDALTTFPCGKRHRQSTSRADEIRSRRKQIHATPSQIH